MNDLFPIPLVNKNRMNVIRDLVAADRVHIRVEPFSMGKTIFLQRIALPLGKGLNDLGISAGLFLDVKSNRTLDAV